MRIACASSALLASSLRADSISDHEDYNIVNADGCPVDLSPEYFVMSSSGAYRLTVEATVDFFFSFGTSVNPTQLGASAQINVGGPPFAGYTTNFEYHVDMPFTISTSESTTTIWGINFTTLSSDPDASYTAWRKYGTGPQMGFSGKIGTVSTGFTWWY